MHSFSATSICVKAVSFIDAVTPSPSEKRGAKPILESKDALSLIYAGMQYHKLDGKILCSACGFSSHLTSEPDEILWRHFQLQKKCPNGKRNLRFIHRKLMSSTNFADWNQFSYFQQNMGFSLAEEPTDHAMAESETEPQISEAETLETFKGIPQEPKERSRLAEFTKVNPADVDFVEAETIADQHTGLLSRKLGFIDNDENLWTCLKCGWASPSENLETFAQQHSSFSRNCSDFEKKADYQTRGFVASSEYRSIKRRVFSESTDSGKVLCYLSQPETNRGIEVMKLFLFWETTLTIDRNNRSFLEQVYRIVTKLEQIYEIKFIVPLRDTLSSKPSALLDLKDHPISEWPASSRLSAPKTLSNDWISMIARRDSFLETLQCGICCDSPDLYINLECGHVMLCFDCILRLPQTNKTCPICRTSLSAVQKFQLK